MSANADLMEHRWGIRVELGAVVELRSAENWSATAVVRDASLSGAFIETDAQPLPLSRVSLRMVARTGEWLEGCVVRVQDGGFAIEWLDPGIQALAALLSLRRDAPVTRVNRETANHSHYLQ
jgi:hypothetical protein